MCVLLCFTVFIAIPKQLCAIYIFWTLKIQYSGTMEREWIRVKKLVFCPNFAHQFLFFIFFKNTQFQILLWYFHNYEHYIWIVFTPIVFSWLSAPPDPFPLLDIPLFLSCLFCVEGHAFNRGCFQKWGGERCLQAHEPLTSGREVGTLRVPSYLRTGCWWAWDAPVLWAQVGHDCVVPRRQHSTATSSFFGSYHSLFLMDPDHWREWKTCPTDELWSTLTYSQLSISWEPLIVLLPTAKRIFLDQIRNNNPYT